MFAARGSGPWKIRSVTPMPGSGMKQDTVPVKGRVMDGADTNERKTEGDG